MVRKEGRKQVRCYVPVSKGWKIFKKSQEQCETIYRNSNKANAVGTKPIFPQPLPPVCAARLTTARTGISSILDFLWFPEPALPMDMAGWKFRELGHTTPHQAAFN